LRARNFKGRGEKKTFVTSRGGIAISYRRSQIVKGKGVTTGTAQWGETAVRPIDIGMKRKKEKVVEKGVWRQRKKPRKGGGKGVANIRVAKEAWGGRGLCEEGTRRKKEQTETVCRGLIGREEKKNKSKIQGGKYSSTIKVFGEEKSDSMVQGFWGGKKRVREKLYPRSGPKGPANSERKAKGRGGKNLLPKTKGSGRTPPGQN